MEWLWWQAWLDPHSFNHVVVRRSEDLGKVAFDGPSGLFRIIPPAAIHKAVRSPWTITLTNGARILGFSADEPDTLRGPECHRVVCDELAAWRQVDRAWNDGVLFSTRLKSAANGGRPRIVVTTTPRPVKVLRDLVAEAKRGGSGILHVSGSTYDNRDNLSEAALSRWELLFKGTRRGRQELLGELLDDIPGALWTWESIENGRTHTIPQDLKEVVIGVDPAVSSQESSNETGIIGFGRDASGRGFVMADRSGIMSPDEWGRTAVMLHDDLEADCVVAEVNQGGEMVAATVRHAAAALYRERARPSAHIAVRQVRASRGKYVRAEPISALYAQGLVSHVGEYEVLEGQMVSFTPDLDRKAAGSPDRLDALVWAATKLMLGAKADVGRQVHADLTKLPSFAIR